MFRILIALVIAMTAAGCGVDSMSAAATAAALKQKEIEEGKKTMAKAQADIQKAMDQTQKNAEKAGEADK
jgi:ribosomal protein L12E/L44/L45/RPP1/RPP2